MLYKPKFCCECGEKIERIDWKLWTNRRFCEVCEAEHKLSDLLPKAGILVCVLVGLFGLGSLLKAPTANEYPVIRRTVAAVPPQASANKGATANAIGQSQPSGQLDGPGADANLRKPGELPARARPPAVTEAVYLCGARTKKGTPCTRRVKGNVRCWQHIGMPAIEPPEKLLVSR